MIEKIKTLKKRYRKEWLLIVVDKTDETTTPVSGRLIAHSPRREDIYERLMKQRSRLKKLLVEYSEDSFPKGYAAAF